MKVMNKKQGFTLIELLIVIAILGILAAVAYPAYTKVVFKAKRTEAQTILVELANKQEMYYLDHHQYAANLQTELGLNANPFITSNEYYSISTSSTSPTTGFSLIATAINSQADDEDCAILQITHERTTTAFTKSGDVATNCWK